MLRFNAGSLSERVSKRSLGSVMLAIGISLGLHGAAFAFLVLFREVSPPEPYAVIEVELVQAVGSTSDMESPADISTQGDQGDQGDQGEKSIAVAVPSGSKGFTVARDGESIPIPRHPPRPENTSDRQETVSLIPTEPLVPIEPPAPTEPLAPSEPLAPTEPPGDSAKVSRPAAPTKTKRSFLFTPRRKPLAPVFSSVLKTTKRMIEEKPPEIKDGSPRLIEQKPAREGAQTVADRPTARTQQTVKKDLGKSHVMAALPMIARDSRPAGGLGARSGTPSRYAGAGLSNAPPRYPYLARRRGQEGRVVLRVQVTAGGDPAEVQVRWSSGYRLLDDAAITAVKAWRFAPASRGGISVASSVDVPVSFKLIN